MACRGCSSSDGCGCSVVGSGGISVTGSGTPVTDPYVVNLDLNTELATLTVDDTTPCGSLSSPHVPVRLGSGTTVLVPLPCTSTAIQQSVPGDAFAFTFDGGTTDADPGAGKLRFNNATYSSVTFIYVSNSETNGSDVSAWLDSIDNAVGTPKGRIRVYSRTTPTKWADFNIAGVVTTGTNYRKVPVTFNASNSTLTTTLADTVFDFTPSSDTTGAMGPTGATGGFNSVQAITTVTGTYTLLLTDQGALIKGNNASAFNITVPPNSSVAFPIGAHIDIGQYGAGQISMVAGAGVTIRYTPGLKLYGQYAMATLVKIATDEWWLSGNLTP